MTYRTSAVLICALLLTACGGGDPHEKAAKESVSVMEDMVEILEGVTDKASAEAAKGKLEKLMAKMKEMQAEAMKLGEPTPEQQKKLMEMAQETQALGQRLMAAIMKISQNPETQAVLGSMMRDMK